MVAHLTFPETALVLEARPDHLHRGLTQAKEGNRKTVHARDKSFQTAYLLQAWEGGHASLLPVSRLLSQSCRRMLHRR